MNELRQAKVVKVYPEENSVDLVYLEDGRREASVQVLSPFASTNTGLHDLPDPTPPLSGPYDPVMTRDRDIIAIVGFLRGAPVVLGFLYPQVNQMLFADRNRRIMRHASDVYTSIDKDGNTELSHPSGSYLRIGTAPGHEDLTGQDFDQKWIITKNTDTAVHVHLEVHNAGAMVAMVNIDPSGNVNVEHTGDLTVSVGGSTTVNSAGPATLVAPSVTVDTPSAAFTGNVSVSGSVTVDGDVVASGISLVTHTHGGVLPGGANTGPPA